MTSHFVALFRARSKLLFDRLNPIRTEIALLFGNRLPIALIRVPDVRALVVLQMQPGTTLFSLLLIK